MASGRLGQEAGGASPPVAVSHLAVLEVRRMHHAVQYVRARISLFVFSF